ncbi:DUF4145 domain-containing protein [Stenotrophomonas maltophilia group sp. vghtpe118]|uniref:DUF4145 domain-containing protein n=1 Tax=Stenotrophomonas maltophilia group sp. vghtpe118 TaxID=3459469 RepID=UPI0031CE552D
MSVTLVRDCPHCSATNVAMQPIALVSKGNTRSTAAFSCNRCSEILCIGFFHPANSTNWVMSFLGDFDRYIKQTKSSIVIEYPKKDRLTAPASVPQAVERSFVQGLDNARRGNTDAAASMFRKAIDAATRELDPSLAGKMLAKRIDLLADDGKLTTDLKEWAHLIRLDGNQGAHDDEELTAAEVEQLEEFTKLFLIYTFTLPAQVLARKAGAEP